MLKRFTLSDILDLHRDHIIVYFVEFCLRISLLRLSQLMHLKNKIKNYNLATRLNSV